MTYTDEESLLSPFRPELQDANRKKKKMKNLIVIPPDSGVSAQNSQEIPKDVAQEKKPFPALGIILAFLSVWCYSLGSAMVNLLPQLHSLEIMSIR